MTQFNMLTNIAVAANENPPAFPVPQAVLSGVDPTAQHWSMTATSTVSGGIVNAGVTILGSSDGQNWSTVAILAVSGGAPQTITHTTHNVEGQYYAYVDHIDPNGATTVSLTLTV